LGYVSAIDSNGRTIWIADAQRGNGQRFVVCADEKLTAFIELETAICTCDERLPAPAADFFVADAHRDDGKRFVVRAEEKLTAFCGTKIGDSSSRRIVLTSGRDFFQTRRR
jgi:hypothetical protein